MMTAIGSLGYQAAAQLNEEERMEKFARDSDKIPRNWGAGSWMVISSCVVLAQTFACITAYLLATSHSCYNSDGQAEACYSHSAKVILIIIDIFVVIAFIAAAVIFCSKGNS